MTKYGIFGGVFDPFHYEHLKIIEDAHNDFNLEKIIVLPSFNPPHKSHEIASFQDRINIINMFIKDINWIILEDIEKQLDLSKSYTYMILEQLKKKYFGEFVYIIGGDSLINFPKWKNPDIIATMTSILVYPRKGYPNLDKAVAEVKSKFNASIYLANTILEDVSSSEIRAMIEINDINIVKFLPNDVLDYIKKSRLYSEYSEIILKLKNEVSPKTFIHSLNTARYSVRLASKFGIQFHKSFLAGLLHDCAKGGDFGQNEYNNITFPVIHQYASAKKAQNYFGIDDIDIIDAIKYHTTGNKNMSLLAKIIYVADKVEYSRNYEEVDNLRIIADENIDKAFIAILKNTIDLLNKNRLPIDKLTIETLLWYNDGKIQKD